MSSYEESAFTFLPLGGIIQEFRVAGLNIVQAFPTEALYKELNDPFFGETIGRTTNRLNDGKIELNGKTVNLTKNNGLNALHGGPKGWGKQTFRGPKPVFRNGKEGVLFTYLSPDGDEGYPGTVEFRLWYMANKGMEDGIEKTVLEMEYEVEFVGDECDETVVGVTNHRYHLRIKISSSPYLTNNL
jgi:aldose 1-epimerase